MANFYGTGRTNYVRFTNMDRVHDLCSVVDMTIVEGTDGRVCLLFDTEDGDPPTLFSEYEECLPFIPEGAGVAHPIRDVLAPLLADGEVLVVVRAGAEKHRYISAYAYAVDNKGVEQRVDLVHDLFDKIKQQWPGVPVTEPEY